MKMIIELKGVLAAKATAKTKSELNTEKAETAPVSHVSGNTAQCPVRNNRSVGPTLFSNTEKEEFSKDRMSTIDMRTLATAIAETRWRKTTKTDELEASGEADSYQS